jgi:hypothetical protein
MQHHPLDYETPKLSQKPVLRRVFGRIVIGAWILCAALLVLGFAFIVNDRSSLQFPAAIAWGFSMIGAAVLTVVHWLLVVPILWFQKQGKRERAI